MDKLLQQASAAGIDESQSKNMMGGVLSLLKNKMSAEDFGKISSAIPETDSLVQETETRAASGADSGSNPAAGLMSSAMGMLGGGGNKAASGEGAGVQSSPQLLTYLSGLGIDQQQVTKFLPMASGFLKNDAGVDASAALGTGGSSGGGGDIASQAASFLGGFVKK